MEDIEQPFFHPLGECDPDYVRIDEMVIGFDGIGMDWIDIEQGKEYGRVVEAVTISRFPVEGRSGRRLVGLLKIEGHDGFQRRFVVPDLGDRPVRFTDLPLDPRL